MLKLNIYANEKSHIPLFCILMRFKRIYFKYDKLYQIEKIMQQRAGKHHILMIIVISSTFQTSITHIFPCSYIPESKS